MAHNITSEKNFAYTGAKPWHGIGTAVPGLMTVGEALKLGGLDFTVDTRPATFRSSLTGEEVGVPDKYVTVRTDTVPETPLGVVGARYTVVQNVAALDFFDTAVGEGSAAIETVGCLGKGERVFMVAKVPDFVELVENDPADAYLVFTTTHDGTGSIECLFTPIRVVCQNTMTAALRGATNRIKLRHTASAPDKLKLAHTVLASNRAYWDRIRHAYAYMAKKDLSRMDTIELVEKLFPGESTRGQNIRKEVLILANGALKGRSTAKVGTAYGLFNAITEYIDHERTTRNGNTNFEASMFGSGAKLRQDAFDLLTTGMSG